MNLTNFEEYVEDVILERGQQYFTKGHVEKITEAYPNQFLIEIYGSNNYTVEVATDDGGNIVSTSCDCPYDWGVYCKHQVAAFYALHEQTQEISTSIVKKTASAKNKGALNQILSEFSKDELLEIILNVTSEYEEIEKELLFKYAPTEDEIASSKKLIRNYINQYKRRGFIEWNDVYDALKGAQMTLNKASQKLEMNDAESAVSLGLTVLPIVVDMIQYCDDSSGHVGDVINESLRIIDKAVLSGVSRLDEREQKKLYDRIVKEALHKRFDGWTEWRYSLLETCIYFCDHANIRKKLENQLTKMLTAISDSSWNAEYEKNELDLLRLKIIERYDEEEKALAFINDRIQYSPFREKAIVRLMNQGEYKEVITLCKEGEELDKKYRGLISKWMKYQLQAYEGLGDIEKQREFILEFLYANDFSYYGKLKELYKTSEWEGILQDILTHFEKQQYIQSGYVQILLEEKLYGKLLEYCKSDVSQIEYYYQYLVDDYFEEVNDIFKEHIERIAKQARDRRAYKTVCKVIKTYKKVFGDIRGHAIIRELKQTYNRRPAFVDELGKIK